MLPLTPHLFLRLGNDHSVPNSEVPSPHLTPTSISLLGRESEERNPDLHVAEVSLQMLPEVGDVSSPLDHWRFVVGGDPSHPSSSQRILAPSSWTKLSPNTANSPQSLSQ
jgi:hypothetical protein